MKKALQHFGLGCLLVGVISVALVIMDGDWALFMMVNGSLAAVLIFLFSGTVTGVDKRRPPGVARVSAARWAGPMSPDELARREHTYQGDDEAVAAAETLGSRVAFSYLLVAVAPAAAAIICLLTVG
ncbi:MAG: hypothetical protein WC709_03565 [Thermoleophilia bacterium]